MLNEPLLGLTPPEYRQVQANTRISMLISGLMYPLWGFLVASAQAPLPVRDPLGLRLIIAALAVLSALAFWRHTGLRRLMILLCPVPFLMVGHQLWLIHVNQMMATYVAILYMMMPLMAMGFVFLPMQQLFLGAAMVALAAIGLLHDGLPLGARLGPLLGASLLSVLSYSHTRLRHRAAQELRDARAQLLTAHQELAQSARAMQDILDHVGNGFFIVDAQLVVQPAHTRSCLEMLQTDVLAGRPLVSLLPGLTDDERGMIELHLQQVFQDLIPPEVSLEQMPALFEVGERTLHLRGRALRGGDGAITGVLFTVTDHTELLAARRQTRLNEILLELVRRRDAFHLFLREANSLLDGAAEDLSAGDVVSARRALHTLKGNAGVFRLEDLSAHIHQIESGPALEARHVAAVRRHLEDFLAEHRAVLGLSLEAELYGARSVSAAQLSELRGLVEPAAVPVRVAVLSWLARVRAVPAGALLEAVTAQVARIAERLGKRVRLELVGSDVPVDPERLGPVLQALPHLLNNALDHGIEPPEERGDKPEAATLAVSVSRTEGLLQIEVRDDGRGIDGEALLRRALDSGQLTAEQAARLTARDRLALIFQDGLSTAKEVTQLSGRGVGLSAVQAAVSRCGGGVVVDSEAGRGTRVQLRVPA